MMKNINNTEMLIELTLNELVNIEGGGPTQDSGFWYDAAWAIGMDIKIRFIYGIVY